MSAASERGVTPARRFLLGAVLILSLAFVGMTTGALAAARFVVEPGSGLAGPPEVLAYGLACAATGAGVGLYCALRFSGRRLARAAVGTLIGATLCLVALMLRATQA